MSVLVVVVCAIIPKTCIFLLAICLLRHVATLSVHLDVGLLLLPRVNVTTCIFTILCVGGWVGGWMCVGGCECVS